MDVTTFVKHGKKIVCVGKNYAKHAAELAQGGAQGSRPLWRAAADAVPTLFLKPTTSYVEEGEPIEFSTGIGSVHHEVELGIIIGTRCKNLPPTREAALGAIAGYCLALDLTAREQQLAAKEAGMPWSVSKGYDTFCPVSKFIPKKDVEHPEKLTLWLAVNGDERQRGTTADMLHPIEAILAHASACMTLEPGDLVLTGTPEGVGPLVHGDTITAGIEGVVDVTFSVRTTDSS